MFIEFCAKCKESGDWDGGKGKLGRNPCAEPTDGGRVRIEGVKLGGEAIPGYPLPFIPFNDNLY